MNQPSQTPHEANRDLEALLDTALAPQSVPGGLPQDLSTKILSSTTRQLSAQRTPVIAVISPTAINAIAAGMMLAATLGLFMVLRQPPSQQQIWAQLDQEIEELAAISSTTDDLDHQIGLLATQINDFESQNGHGAASQLLEDELLEYELQFDPGPSLFF